MASPSSSSTQPPPQPAAQQKQQQQQPPAAQWHNTNPFIHYVALGTTPLALLGLALPPRRLEMATVVLGGVALWGTHQLVYDYSGRSPFSRFAGALESLSPAELPDKAKETQLRIRAERARRAAAASEDLRLIEEQRRKTERGVLEKVWMGDSGDDWKQKRDQREKEALAEGGGGYWSLIVDQVSEVFSGGKKEGGGDVEKQAKPAGGESKKS
ncbi:hypothetical protein F4804DRAFT_345913 [Jackrogersella minutella]|nr:hypothetical protein F4804DRAFT_345913 [Jackrogersella minutella]